MAITRFKGAHAFLSNFYPCRVVWNETEFPSVEHAYQAAKTIDAGEFEKILGAKTAGEAKRLGKRVKHLNSTWDEMKVSVMRRLLERKFRAGSELAKQLIATDPEELIEDNWWGDTFWGVCKGEGENWLGRLLMDVRSELRSKHE